jgi:hypothetical protein
MDNDKCSVNSEMGPNPLKTSSERFNKCIEYALAALSPYVDAQIMNWATLGFFYTGLLFNSMTTNLRSSSATISRRHSRSTADNNQPVSRMAMDWPYRKSTIWQKNLPIQHQLTKQNIMQCKPQKTKRRLPLTLPRKH